MAYVYLITNKINNKKYIGSSRKENIDPHYLGSGKLIKQALQKYGKENFIKEILWEGKGNARNVETYWLEHFNASVNPQFYNMTNDARGNELHKENSKKTVSEKLTGRKFSKETCEKIRLAKLGKPNSKKGKSDGPKPGVSKAHKGRISPNKGNIIIQYDLKDNIIQEWENMQKASNYYNINSESIRQCLRGISKTCIGYKWKYK
jgi:group I intron endonuclease